VVKSFSNHEANSSRDGWVYALSALLGLAAGSADVALDDLLVTALVVLSACLVLGMVRPERPWRWVVAVGASVPLTELAAFFVLTLKPTRAQIYGSFLAFLPGIAGAYGGATVRRVLENLRHGR
jgi:ABC-type multidrug transport system permease subunit